ncbi:MAG TPA: amidase [Baekduia sp.]|uniref:amidase n=1 Tax=Baekduia sp. TaxID=2600305 RepID=UPI002D77DDB5|nr:amidase [Baekduia sp.]HET6509729.1 amidase [Baekduia sp.]
MSTAAGADLLFRPVHELAGLVKDGELSARELVQTSLDRIAELNPTLNAFVDVFAEDALAEADGIAADDPRPFAGVPIAIKNNRAVAGRRLTFASHFVGDFVAPYDHNVVARLKRAGFVIVGTTTLPEWGIMPTTETARFGPTRNPWDQSRTPGGSSGGSGAAVASGMVPIAHANDGGGSTRIPAACNGLVGLKPQRGRISLAPEVGHMLLVQDGVLTRTVRETAELLDLLAGYELGDMTWAPPNAEPFAAAVGRAPGKLRIAMSALSPVPEAEVDPVCVQAMQDAGALLESLGHEVVEADPPWARPELSAVFTASFGPAVCTQIKLAELIAGREATADDMEPLSWALYQLCKNIDSIDALAAELQLHGVGRELVTWISQYDALLTPALAEAPVTLGTLDPLNADDPLGGFTRSASFTPFTPPLNISGSPAISLPLYQREDGLPLGIQLIGQPAGEAALLSLASQLEAAHGWSDRRPTL